MMLIGNMYDLKQDPNGKPTRTDYYVTLGNFIKSNFNTDLLDGYFKSKEIFNTHFFIPKMQAAEGPKAFGLEKEVAPSRWFVYYRGGFSPQKSGEYRFWSRADDTLVAAVNGRVVIDVSRTAESPGNWENRAKEFEWKGEKRAFNQNYLSAGDWMRLSDRETYRLDLIIGENPGSLFECYLMIEEKGKNYKVDPAGYPILPVFSTLPLRQQPQQPEALKTTADPLVMTPKRNILAEGGQLEGL